MTTTREAPRIFFADLIPIETPDRLSDLQGPKSGYLDLPISVYWGPTSRLPINTDNDLICAYQEVIYRGTKEELCEFLNEEHLRRLWHLIHPSDRVRNLWESKFPELADVSR
ncbi:hypothetical protein G7Y41_01150 [Schaalia sp. ZJ405]|uniref:hypothetical protein n=1 Tax=Schaalia sp. ZJ405 TaxID=2709403 RepID=UPI0013EAED0A|nr:hypothetical protein [Schaalia sp. ZJ405]QPK81499.1 hypothetical protein G7Y41_01150 [Schaalia sp. ZJ405]